MTRRRTIIAVLLVTAAAFGLHAALAAGPVVVPIPVLLVLGYGVLGVGFLVAAARPPKPTTGRIGEGDVSGYGYPDRPFGRARHWQERFDLTDRDGVYFDRVVLPELRDLAADRLRARRGVDLDAEPERARDLLGPRVWALLTPTGPRRPPNVAQMSGILDDLEAL